jgi:hypothetical protein
MWTEIYYDDAAHPPCLCGESPDFIEPEEVQNMKWSLRPEFFLRTVTLPADPGCFSTKTRVCETADKIIHQHHDETYNARFYYWVFIGVGLASARINTRFLKGKETS